MGYSFKPIRRGPRQVWQHPKRFVVWCGIDYSSLHQGDFGPGAIMHAFALPDEVLKKIYRENASKFLRANRTKARRQPPTKLPSARLNAEDAKVFAKAAKKSLPSRSFAPTLASSA